MDAKMSRMILNADLDAKMSKRIVHSKNGLSTRSWITWRKVFQVRSIKVPAKQSQHQNLKNMLTFLFVCLITATSLLASGRAV